MINDTTTSAYFPDTIFSNISDSIFTDEKNEENFLVNNNKLRAIFYIFIFCFFWFC